MPDNPENRENSENRESRENRENSENSENRENRESRESRESRENRESRESRMDGRRGIPEQSDTSEGPPGTDAEADDGAGGQQPRRRFTWKRVALIAVALVAVGSLVQVIAKSGGFGGALNTTGGKSEHNKSVPSQIKQPTQKPKTVRLGGQKIPRQSGPIIVVNPGLVTPGGTASVEGAGFDAKSTVDLLLKTSAKQTKGQGLSTAKTDRTGSLNTQITLPENIGRGATLVVQQRNANNVAEAQLVSGGVVGSLKINKAVGKPGDGVSVSVRGFGAGEKVDVFWGRVGGKPDATVTTDGSGGIGRADIKVGIAPTGTSTLILVGEKSKTTATAPFQVLGLYPTVKSSPYALKAGKQITVSAAGFAPSERVLFYINSASGIPAFTSNADANGNVGSVSFDVPFGLEGSQSLTVIGDRTRAVVRAGFDVLPYTPTADPSTYSGKAGTAVSFYVGGFAANETVTLYAGGPNGDAKKIATFPVDAKGAAEAAGSYLITKADEGGVSFKLVGSKSGASAKASVNSQQGGQQQGGQQQGGQQGQGQ
ncbi:hypothetical protein ACFVTY_39530 [Streptomyces sp. NPDC058067]|uniref:hypothetical protein n=1 Tax=Streptomyces sp. NPDC058067 TaxID=3346324 RepID=UPI0036E47499